MSSAETPHPGVSALTAQDVVDAGRRGVVSLASDPKMRHYSADTLSTVYQATIRALAGSGADEEVIAERLNADPAVKDVPIEVLEVVAAASYVHFARALATRASGEPTS